MNAEPVCSLCCCLRGAVQNIRWGVLVHVFVGPGTVASFRAICSDLNDLGRGYLQWTLVIPHEESGEMWAACWIALARERYFSFVTRARPGLVTALCPDLPAFYQTLDTLHQNCRRLPTVLYTLNCEAAEDDAHHVRILAMNGEVVHDVTIPRSVPWNAWRHIPLPRHRTALNGNLYTLPAYQECHEHVASSEIWAHQPPCYEHCIAFVHANDVCTQLSSGAAKAWWTFY